VHFENEESLDNFISAFEAGTWPAADWKHAHHLIMAACYVMKYGRDQALDRARKNIAAYNEAQGGRNTDDSGYHETLTVFWIDAVTRALPPGKPRLEAIRHIVEMFASRRDLWREFYSFDIVKSREARKVYVAPDL
jgi:hypothetical protein